MAASSPQARAHTHTWVSYMDTHSESPAHTHSYTCTHIPSQVTRSCHTQTHIRCIPMHTDTCTHRFTCRQPPSALLWNHQACPDVSQSLLRGSLGCLFSRACTLIIPATRGLSRDLPQPLLHSLPLGMAMMWQEIGAGADSPRRHLHPVIDELRPAAPCSPQFLPPLSRWRGAPSSYSPCFSLIKHLALCGLGSLRPSLTVPPPTNLWHC